MTEEVTKIVGNLCSISNSKGDYSLVIQDKKSGSRIFVKYQSYNEDIWWNLKDLPRYDASLSRHGTELEVIVKGKLEDIKTDYEGIGIIKVLGKSNQ